MIQTKTEAIDLIYSSYNKAKTSSDEITRVQYLARELLNSLGSPDNHKQIVLVTGSKGKGSTASFISSLLHRLGYKTGLFTSPHYISFNERVQVNGIPISDSDFVRLANRVAPHVYKIVERLKANEYLGPIAINLAIALLYFSEKQVDFIILEAGKGGKNDDTNVVHNQWSVITPIFNEHIDELGPTISHIITHKLGIIKKNSVTLISKQQKNIVKEIDKSLAAHENVFTYERDFSVLHSDISKSGMTFDFKTSRAIYKNLHVPLFGSFQCENIALAVQTCERILGKMINQTEIHQWLKTLTNFGKCELLLDEPVVIADATINEHSATYLREVITYFSRKNVVAIVGLSRDKDYKGVVHTLAPFTKRCIISKPTKGYKSFHEQEIFHYSSHLLPCEVVSSPEEAVKHALNQSKNDLIVVVGNHSFIAETRQWFTTIVQPI
ncbi:bifunctional folylpolyglutamate synthase/dihydrofolate synthase [Pueribacillus sp. YX66]|uniref:bifunctional folylpolyglutamate synthase/dihydrofolate synthase n=1 Tax=Pueribacillus sp. YX66 TaxID=3229242 RepID=UPI00358D9DA5